MVPLRAFSGSLICLDERFRKLNTIRAPRAAQIVLFEFQGSLTMQLSREVSFDSCVGIRGTPTHVHSPRLTCHLSRGKGLGVPQPVPVIFPKTNSRVRASAGA